MKFILGFKKSKFVKRVIGLLRVVYFPLFLIDQAKLTTYRINGPEETVREIVREKKSISRFGDGEMNLILKEKGIGFQKYNSNLKRELVQTLQGSTENLIAFPHALKGTKRDRFFVKTFWWSYLVRNFSKVTKIFKLSNRDVFYDASFTRIITELKNKRQIDNVVYLVKKIWDNKDIILIEGEGTRFGVGNGLLNTAKSVHRIVAPEKDAYEVIEKLEVSTLKLISEFENSENIIVLLALGPTATVLSSRLSTRVQAIDIGHFDLQYEFFKRNSYDAVDVENKYDNESYLGNHVTDEKDEQYLSEIYKKVN